MPFCLWYVYSWLNALPIGDDWMCPLHTLYAVKTVSLRSSCPRNEIVLHLPRPELSLLGSLRAMGTRLLVARVSVPPDWKLSASGIGSISLDG
jgi:hypothetical protein